MASTDLPVFDPSGGSGYTFDDLAQAIRAPLDMGKAVADAGTFDSRRNNRELGLGFPALMIDFPIIEPSDTVSIGGAKVNVGPTWLGPIIVIGILGLILFYANKQ